jgi:RNA polymerase sigma-70 factor (ECF subfamily)
MPPAATPPAAGRPRRDAPRLPDVRSCGLPSDDWFIGIQEQPPDRDPVVAIYRVALPQVYGYLLPRCGSVALAEDLTAETFMAAVAAVRRGRLQEVTVAWLVGVARHKLVDHWRRVAREQRGLAAVEREQEDRADPWGEVLDVQAAHDALLRLSVPQRSALTLRYLDGLSVPEVAEHLGRSVHATETLLVRARAALRRVYEEEDQGERSA